MKCILAIQAKKIRMIDMLKSLNVNFIVGFLMVYNGCIRNVRSKHSQPAGFY